MTNPEGRYTKVKVTPIQGGSGSLADGTGTFTSYFVFSAGQFPGGDHPKVGDFYNISGVHADVRYEFPGWKCGQSGGTSDFAAN